MGKNPTNQQREEENPVFAELMKKVENEKKKTKIVYLVATGILLSSIFAFLLFGPFRVPVFSQLGDKILSREEVTEKKGEVAKEIEEVLKEEKEVDVEENKVEEVTTPTPSPTPKPTPKPIPTPAPKTYLCTDQEIADLRVEVTTLEGYLSDTENRLNQFFFQCFDRLRADYPNQFDSFYTSECGRIICIEMYPDLCNIKDEFTSGLSNARTELNRCLSDR